MKRFRFRKRAEVGETLIEVLIASTLMGIVVLAVIGGISTMLFSSNIHRTQGNANVALVEAVENMKALPFSQVSCSSSEAEQVAIYQGAASAPPGWTAEVTIKYERLNGGVIDFEGVVCVPSLPFQLVTVTLKSPDTLVSPSMSFVKGTL